MFGIHSLCPLYVPILCFTSCDRQVTLKIGSYGTDRLLPWRIYTRICLVVEDISIIALPPMKDPLSMLIHPVCEAKPGLKEEFVF